MHQEIKVGKAISLFRSVIFVPLVIIIAWQFPLYYGKNAGSVTALLRTCYEILGTYSELRSQPPSFILSVCSRQVPPHFSLELAKEHSTIVRMQRLVEGKMLIYHEFGFLKYLTSYSMKEVIHLLEGAVWVMFIPSLIMAASQIRSCVLCIYLTAAFYKIPVRFAQLGNAFHFVASFSCFLDIWAPAFIAGFVAMKKKEELLDLRELKMKGGGSEKEKVELGKKKKQNNKKIPKSDLIDDIDVDDEVPQKEDDVEEENRMSAKNNKRNQNTATDDDVVKIINAELSLIDGFWKTVFYKIVNELSDVVLILLCILLCTLVAATCMTLLAAFIDRADLDARIAYQRQEQHQQPYGSF